MGVARLCGGGDPNPLVGEVGPEVGSMMMGDPVGLHSISLSGSLTW
jgi:hypothetical protein